MRISDWSSDVCSSDLRERIRAHEAGLGLAGDHVAVDLALELDLQLHRLGDPVDPVDLLAVVTEVEDLRGRAVAGLLAGEAVAIFCSVSTSGRGPVGPFTAAFHFASSRNRAGGSGLAAARDPETPRPKSHPQWR